MNRGLIAVVALSGWIAALGWQAKRVYFPSEAQRLATGVRTLPPGVAYYAVYRGNARVGWSRLEVDTLPRASGFRVLDRLYLDLPSLGEVGRSERSAEEWLDANLELDSLVTEAVAGGDTSRFRYAVEADSVIRSFDLEGREIGRAPLEGPVTTSAGWRLRLAAGGQASPGRRFTIPVFDPFSGAARSAEIEVLSSSVLVVPDSADTDPITGEWIPAREDTVGAWLVRTGTRDAEREQWVDEDGRLVHGAVAGGLRVERTAFELAFFTRAGERE